MPLNSFGEKTSNVSEMVCATSAIPRLSLSDVPNDITYSSFRYSVNFKRNTPGILTLSFAKTHSCPARPSTPRKRSGVCTTSPAEASAPVGVLTWLYVGASPVDVGSGCTIEARTKYWLSFALSSVSKRLAIHLSASSTSITGGGSTGLRSTGSSAKIPLEKHSLVSFSSLYEHSLALSGCCHMVKEWEVLARFEGPATGAYSCGLLKSHDLINPSSAPILGIGANR
jgi:hypothetical protein